MADNDGQGPREGSYQAEHSEEGKKKEAGEECPEENK